MNGPQDDHNDLVVFASRPQHQLAAVQKLCETVSTQKRANDSSVDTRDWFRRDLLSTQTIRFLLLVPVAGMAKLADAADLKSAGAKSPVGVRFPLPAPDSRHSSTGD